MGDLNPRSFKFFNRDVFKGRSEKDNGGSLAGGCFARYHLVAKRKKRIILRSIICFFDGKWGLSLAFVTLRFFSKLRWLHIANKRLKVSAENAIRLAFVSVVVDNIQATDLSPKDLFKL